MSKRRKQVQFDCCMAAVSLVLLVAVCGGSIAIWIILERIGIVT